jgi:hypothetical protein
VTYTPAAGYHGPDTFSYHASDGTATSPPALVTLTVESVAPVVSLAADRTTAQAPADIRFTATGSDPDGGSIARYVFSVDGTDVQSGPSPTLDQHFGEPGTHAVAVRAVDDEGEAATATRTVEITKAPDVTPPGGGGSGGGGGGGGGGASDTTPPVLTVSAAKQKLKALLAKGLALKASCSEACTLKIQLSVDKATARKLKLGSKPVIIGSLTTAGGSGARTLHVKLTAKARKALKRAKALKVKVRVIATDAAGNAAAPVSRAVAVRK